MAYKICNLRIYIYCFFIVAFINNRLIISNNLNNANNKALGSNYKEERLHSKIDK